MRHIRPRTFFLILCSVLAALVILAPLVGWIRIYRVPTSSMTPTIQKDDKVLATRIGKPAAQLERNTLVVFDVSKAFPSGTGLRINRLIGLPGDRIEVIGNELWLNGAPLPMRGGLHSSPAEGKISKVIYPLVIPPGQIFVLGDNYGNSLDSRYFGPIPAEAVTKTVVLRTSPLSRFGRVE